VVFLKHNLFYILFSFKKKCIGCFDIFAFNVCLSGKILFCSYLNSVIWLVVFIIAEADLQKLNNALKILSETEKQLRISKNQTTWFTVALLQLSSVDYQSVDANDTKFSLRGACNGGEVNLFPRLVTLFSIPFLLGVWFCQVENSNLSLYSLNEYK